jgi:LDH2 family malate/lactate/ureidoglycolate dehydrogenase
MLDADNAFGHVAGCAGIEKAIEMAQETGIGIVGVRHSNHFAAAGYFCALAAQSNAIGMAFTNAAPRVAAAGGTRAVLGTNPIAFGCPTLSGPPVLFDFATSAISGGSTRSSAQVGNRLPEGVALDASGRPTTDPHEAQRGTLLPAAGAKGFGLALMVEILCGVLTGSAVGEEVGSLFSYERPIDAGHVFLAIDIARFQPLDQFLDRLQTLLLWVKGSATDSSVRFPGELSGTDASRRDRDGIPLPEEAVAPLADLARRLGISCPWE